MVRVTLIALVLLALPSLAAAQPPTGYVLKLQTQAGAPVSTTPLPLSVVTCGVTPKNPQSTTVTNIKKILWDDPSTPLTADCIYTDQGTGPLFALPFGPTAYVAIVAAVNLVGTNADSLPSVPFTRPGTVVPVLTGIRVTP